MTKIPEVSSRPPEVSARPSRKWWPLELSDKSTLVLLGVTRALLAVLFGVYVAGFVHANWGMLTDPALQNDDARTILFPFHAYGSEGSLGDDPIADEMLSAVPWGVRLLYLMFVPIFDVYVASKLVQVVAFGVLVWAAVVLARSRRSGVAAAVLLLFFFLHTQFAVDRIAGGLPRAFGFPCFALWLAGVLGRNRIARFSAPVLLALSYPSVMNMILAAEGFLAVRGIFHVSWGVVGRRLKRYTMLVGVCLLCVLPAAIGSSERGPIHTLAQAEQEPAFGQRGRLEILPFAHPVKSVIEAFLDPARPQGLRPGGVSSWVEKETEMVAMLVITVFLLLPLLRLGPAPTVAGVFFAGALIIYALSRTFAFALYSPERYYSYGMRMACLALLVSSTAHLFYWLRPRSREIARNLFAFCLVGSLWLVLGSGFAQNTGMTINQATDQSLYAFIRTTPKDSRFAAHLLDGDGIPFWGARAHTGSFETLQPWFTESWKRQKKRTLDTLAALYATDEESVLRFTEEYDVTHLLINRSRMGRSAGSTSGSFEPFTSETKKLLVGKSPNQFVLNNPPKESVVFESGRFQVVSVEKLKGAWSKGK
ncbi:MAG: hypothetical protein LC732_00625 [Acidobacteria bacterium]|nr:hypothetical protein [Acidobacteriota bacterium]